MRITPKRWKTTQCRNLTTYSKNNYNNLLFITTGEYVALYQKQRFQLNQKSQDKDQLICQVMREKDELYRKVMHLSALLQSVSPNDVDQTISNINGNVFICSIFISQFLNVCITSTHTYSKST